MLRVRQIISGLDYSKLEKSHYLPYLTKFTPDTPKKPFPTFVIKTRSYPFFGVMMELVFKGLLSRHFACQLGTEDLSELVLYSSPPTGDLIDLAYQCSRQMFGGEGPSYSASQLGSLVSHVDREPSWLAL